MVQGTLVYISIQMSILSDSGPNYLFLPALEMELLPYYMGGICLTARPHCFPYADLSQLFTSYTSACVGKMECRQCKLRNDNTVSMMV